jgi:polysaccharide pyruvyl transferase WcaK-like protein
VDYTTTEQPDTFAVLADLAQAMEDDARHAGLMRNPAQEVDGFAQLPVELQETVKSMSSEELAAVGRMHAALLANGFSVQNGSTGREDAGGGVRRLSMF